MAFPVVEAVYTGNRTLNSTTTSISKPAGFPDSSLAVILMGLDDNVNDQSTSTPGWSLSTAISGDDRLLVAYAWGSAAWPLVINHDNEAAAWLILRIDGADGMPYISSPATGQGASANPPALNPGIGVRDFLWIAAVVAQNDQERYTGTPSGYTGYTSSYNTGSAVSFAWKTAASASEDPGDFTGGRSNGYWASFTLGVAGLVTSQPPSEPTGLMAGASNQSVLLSWQAPAIGAVEDYIIEYRPAGGVWAVYSDGVSMNTSAAVTGLVNDVTYEFRVAAVNTLGQGDWSSVVSATPLVLTTATYYAEQVASGSVTGQTNAYGPSDDVFTASSSGNWTCRWRMEVHEAPVAGEQSMTVRVRSSGEWLGSFPAMTVRLYSGGVLVATLATNVSVNSTSAHNYTYTFDGSLIEFGEHVDVEIAVTGVGFLANTQTSHLDSISWSAVFADLSPTPPLQVRTSSGWDPLDVGVQVLTSEGWK